MTAGPNRCLQKRLELLVMDILMWLTACGNTIGNLMPTSLRTQPCWRKPASGSQLPLLQTRGHRCFCKRPPGFPQSEEHCRASES